MQDDQSSLAVTRPNKAHGNVRELVALPATPSFSLADANTIVEIEIQADQLLAYINKLTSLADRACTAAVRQTESAQLIEEHRHTEITNLRNQLERQRAQSQEQQLALIRLEHDSKAQIAVLQSQLRQSEIHQREAELRV
ncbi:MAG: hypothetical protein ACREQV_11290, partial [Candidatus Binatia bacterium]